jgi:hypothetical protein
MEADIQRETRRVETVGNSACRARGRRVQYREILNRSGQRWFRVVRGSRVVSTVEEGSSARLGRPVSGTSGGSDDGLTVGTHHADGREEGNRRVVLLEIKCSCHDHCSPLPCSSCSSSARLDLLIYRAESRPV